MRSLFVVTAALCAVLYPLSSPCAQQTAPASPAISAPASPFPDGASYRLTVLENDASRGTLLFQPVKTAQTEPSPAVATHAPASPIQSVDSAASPAQADTSGQPAPAPGRPTDINTVPHVPLYAPSSAVEIAWNRFAPRQMAYAPRAWLAPDPAVHSALPLRRAAAKRAASSSQTANTQAKTTPNTPVQQSFDALVSVVTALCPPQATPAASAEKPATGSPVPAAPAAAVSPAPRGPAAGSTSSPAPARGVAAAPNPAAPR